MNENYCTILAQKLYLILLQMGEPLKGAQPVLKTQSALCDV